MEKDKKEEIKKKPGRPSKAEGGGERERSISVSSVRSMNEYVKKKGRRERMEEGKRKIYSKGVG